ncbi:MAG: PAS domain S-box protein [Gammaproteobacteria bacterium]
MTRSAIRRNVLMPWLGLVLLLGRLVIGMAALLNQQHERLLEDAREQARDDLSLIGSYVHEALQHGNYQVIDSLLQEWGAKQRDVDEISLTTANGLLLGYYQSPATPRDTYLISVQIPYSYRGMATLELSKDLDWISKRLTRLRIQLLTAVVVIGFVLWVIVWLAVHRHTEAVTLRERTRELDRANSRLQEELDQRQQAQAALRDSETRLRSILDTAAEGIITINEHGLVQSINRAAEEIFGYTPDETLGRNVSMFMSSPEREAHDGYIAEYLRTGIARIIGSGREVTGRRKDGSPVPLDLSISELRLGSERIFTGVVRDITRRKQAEEQLRQSEEQLRLTFENAPVGIATVAPDGSLLRVNPAFCSIMGYSAAEATRLSVSDFTHPDDRELTRTLYRKIWQGKAEMHEYEKRCIRRDGATIDVRVHIGAIRGNDGGPLLFVVEFEDITERKRVTRELQRMRTYLHNIVNSMPSILVGVDPETRVTEWNAGAEQATGLTAAEAVGRGFAEVLPEFSSQLANLQTAIREHQPVRADRLISEADGRQQYADVVVYPLVANGTLGAVIRIDDVTDRVRLEEMMVQTEKMMSVGGLAAGMAHEINNPLSGVLQSCQNIQRRLSPDLPANRQAAQAAGLGMEELHRYLLDRGILEFVEGIQEAATRASGIVADMLAFSRRSGAPMSPARVDSMLNRVVRLAASDYDLKKKHDFRKVEVIEDFDPQLGEVYCDRMEIEQVFLNLIKNAAQAMFEANTPQSQIILRTRLDTNHARIEVQDNGPGMGEETQRRIFEPFFTTKGVDEGTGLGLSVSYFIITEQHKGSIEVYSTPGKGTCFVVRLPLKGVDRHAPGQPQNTDRG